MLRLTAILLTLTLISCGEPGDWLRNWGMRHRQKRATNLNEAELEMWQKDLAISKEKAEELNKKIHELVLESNRQGMLSWKIAKAYMNAERYEMAAMYFESAMQNKTPEPASAETHFLEQSLPRIKEALQKNRNEFHILLDAGICFANASRDLGWEESRFQTAEYLYKIASDMKPEDTRPMYQLAIMYAKAKEPLRRTDLAIDLLRKIIRINQRDMPARFALGHVLAESGDFDGSASVYREILQTLDELHKAGDIAGPSTKNQSYKKAAENLSKLEECRNAGTCSIGQ